MPSQNQLLYYTQVQVSRAPSLGPTPHLAIGTGPTGGYHQGNSADNIPGFIAEATGYTPSALEYAPAYNTSFTETGETGERPLAIGPKSAQNDFPRSYNHNALLGLDSGIPESIGQGVDGLQALNPTYRAHDSTPGTWQRHQWRSAPTWQVYEFPPDYRQLADYQAVHRYIVQSQTVMPRVLDRADYFYGYAMTPTVAAGIGGMNALGSLGSGG